MTVSRKTPERLEILNPNKAWVSKELKKLLEEWEEWSKQVQGIKDHHYDRNTQAECFADGVENMDAHDVLRSKTLTFLDNNIRGHNFMKANEYEVPYENRLSRLRVKVPHRVKELKILQASLEYAMVPEGFWKEQAKTLIEKLADQAPESALKIAESYLKNPIGSITN